MTQMSSVSEGGFKDREHSFSSAVDLIYGVHKQKAFGCLFLSVLTDFSLN